MKMKEKENGHSKKIKDLKNQLIKIEHMNKEIHRHYKDLDAKYAKLTNNLREEVSLLKRK